MTTTPLGFDAKAVRALAHLTDDEIGHSEEDVKIHFLVPLLHALGHTRVRYEHRGKDALLADGLPRGCTIVIETKRPDACLDAHIAQLERYALEERALLAVLTNGRTVRIYAPFWNRAASFAETLLWHFPRRDLARSATLHALASLLSRDALVRRWALVALQQRQATIESVWASAAALRQQHGGQRDQLHQRLAAITREVANLEAERTRCETRLGQLPAAERERIRGLLHIARIPIVPTGEFADVLPAEPEPPAPVPRPKRKAKRERRPPVPRQWTDDDLCKNVTPYQARIFRAFVAAGRPTLSLKELRESTGLASRVISGATSNFRFPKDITGRDPVIARQRVSAADRLRHGNLYAIAPVHWPTIQRLYGNETRDS